MRPQFELAIPGAPLFVRGVSVIRGASIPVICLSAILGNKPSTASRRLVHLRLEGKRRIAVGVDEVIGVRNLSKHQIEELPPLLKETGDTLIEAISSRDPQLFFVLQAARILPEAVWQQLDAGDSEGD